MAGLKIYLSLLFMLVLGGFAAGAGEALTGPEEEFVAKIKGILDSHLV